MADAKLVVFVESALRAGQSRDAVRNALELAGWSKDQVTDSSAHYADVAFAVPVPRPRAQVSARDAFWCLLMFGTLYLSAFYLGPALLCVRDDGKNPSLRRPLGCCMHDSSTLRSA
jgi:hypothetical protein